MSDQEKYDPIERFFREKAKEYDIQYQEDDWRKLETRLDEVDRQRSIRRRWGLVAAAAIILFLLLSYFTYEQHLRINELNERLSNSERVTGFPNSSSDLAENRAENKAERNNEEENRNNSLADKNSDNTKSEDTAIAKQSHLPSDPPKNAREIAKTEKTSQAGHTTIMEKNQVVIAQVSPGFDGRSPAISAIKPSKFATITNTNAPRTSVPSHIEPGVQAQQSVPRLSVGVLAGPDMSTVDGISHFYKPGYKLGISVEYSLSRNLALSVGASHAKMRYEAYGANYNPPSGYWTNGVVADETRAVCTVIDIPITLKYDFWHFDNSRLYATAGLSSYIMLNEDYRFSYDHYRSGLQERWQENTGTRHWMSSATLSVGYEFDIAQNFSLRAEPFFKLPLKEVGWGNVNLYSLGSIVSINYKIY